MGAIGDAASKQWEDNSTQRADYKKGWFTKKDKNLKSSAPIDGQVMRSGDEYDAFMKQCRKKKGKGKKKTKSQCESEWESNL
jgi:hypothetical protein